MAPHYVMGGVLLLLILLAALSAIGAMRCASKASGEAQLKTKKPPTLVLVRNKPNTKEA